MTKEILLVGIIRSGPYPDRDRDLYNLLEALIEEVGFRTALADLNRFVREPNSYIKFLRESNPCELVIRVPAPYEDGCRQVSKLMIVREAADKSFLLLGPGKKIVDELVRVPVRMQALNEPFDLDAFQQAVIELSRPPRTRYAQI